MAIFNHDLQLPEAHKHAFPLISPLFEREESRTLFKRFDAAAQAAKRKFHGFGLLALVFGILGLVIGLAEVTHVAIGSVLPLTAEQDQSPVATSGGTSKSPQAPEQGIHQSYKVHWSPWAGLVGPAFALAAIGLYFIVRHRGWREKWRGNLYAREQIRQWHFQLFLDGELICKFANSFSRKNADAEITRRFLLLEGDLQNPVATMQAFAESDEGCPLHHPVTPYTDAAVAEQVHEALGALRFSHQIEFSSKKTSDMGEEPGFTVEERNKKSESLAQALFLVAIIIAAFLVFIYIALIAIEHPDPPEPDGDHPPVASHASGNSIRSTSPTAGDHLPVAGHASGEPPHVAGAPTHASGAPTHTSGTGKKLLQITGFGLSSIAVFLAICNAGIRVYRTGYTLPDEAESYLEYANECRRFAGNWEAAFDSSSGTLDTHPLKEIELEACRELRRFLKIKSKATFLF